MFTSNESLANFHPIIFGKPNCSLDLEPDFVTFGLYVGRNYRVSPHSALSKQHTIHQMRGWKASSTFRFYRGTYDSVIGTAHFLPGQFYHALHDMIFPIALIPPEIVAVSYYVSSTILPSIREALEVVGVGSRIIVLQIDEYVIARRIYVFPALANSVFYTWTIRQRFRAIAAQKWRLDLQIPRGIGVLNRPIGGSRRLFDLENITAVCRTKWPKRGWKYSDALGSLKMAAHWFNPLNVAVCATGANCLNAIFMQPGTCLVELQSTVCWGFFVRLAASIHLNYVSMLVPRHDHYESGSRLGKKRGIRLAKFIMERFPE
jgi:hypothetical protein